ncbi:MAG: hypothetical protein M0R17_03185 [Candidatus Omnitrophica bacterium]|jgi:hypothetical protein|nr:hypothetical protein [Candidatus Omnitrophota bacterium]
MFKSKDTKEIKWYWIDGKLHKVSINHNGEQIDLKDLFDTSTKLFEEKKELCDEIYNLGLALTADPRTSDGFVLGWLVRSIKKDKDWKIVHVVEEPIESERNEHIAESLEIYGNSFIEAAKKMRDGTFDKDLKTSPHIGDIDGTGLFK